MAVDIEKTYNERSLFERIGGVRTITQAVSIFYDKMCKDPVTAPYFHKVDMQHQEIKMRMLLTYAFGGAPDYTGRDLRAVHKNMHLTEEHYVAFVRLITETMHELDIPQSLIDEVLLIVYEAHDDVLNL